MTAQERLTIHRQIEQANKRHLDYWRNGVDRKPDVRHIVAVRGERVRQEVKKDWEEQEATRLVNVRIADEALQEMRDMGVIA